jgi:hypothetical protein
MGPVPWTRRFVKVLVATGLIIAFNSRDNKHERRHPMKKIWNALCLAVFVVGLVSFSVSQTRRDDTEVARSFTVLTTHYRLNADGSRTNLVGRITYVRANGELRQTPYDPNSTLSPNNQLPVHARTEEGLLATGNGVERKWISSTPVPPDMQKCFRSAKCISANPRFVRTDQLAGLQVYVFHDNLPDSQPIAWMEQSYSPKTGFLALRTIRHFRDGSEDVLEATSVEFKDVPDDLNRDIRAMPDIKP